MPNARYRDAGIENLDARFRARPGGVTIDVATGRALGGAFEMNGNVALAAGAPPRVTLLPRIEGMDASGLLATIGVPWPALSGRANVSAKLELAWPPAKYLSELTGDVAVDLRDGRIKEAVNLWKVLDLVDFSRWFTSPMAWREEGLAYREARGHLELGEGRVATRDFAVDGPTVNLTVAGVAGLADHSVDAVVTVAVLPRFGQAIDSVPLVGDVTQHIDLTTYAFRVEGPHGDVDVTPVSLDRLDSMLDRVLPVRPLGRRQSSDATDKRTPSDASQRAEP
jgi:uncharacterized protein YhdP